MNELLNHLWQSTAFAAAVAVAAILLRRHSPRLRYWLWLAASMKFLIPFSLLVTTGARVQLPPDTPALHATTVQQISTYFSPAYAAPPVRAAFAWMTLLSAVWIAGAALLAFRWFRRWRQIHRAARSASPLPLRHALPAYSSAAMIEPGVFGIVDPILLLPQDIEQHLSPEQFEAILAHESRHVQYRDNLTAALHMVVETLFWFHPLVWWIGARLTDERERDCDEAALRHGSQPGDYARGIVSVCQNYGESPLLCASGISGADLKTRIREIMTWRGSLPVSRSGKALIALVAVAAISVPFAIGILRAQTLPPAPALSYDAVSIHKSDAATNNRLIGPGPQGGWRTTNTPVRLLIATAYHVQQNQILDAPGWAATQGYDITFTPDKLETPLTNSSSLKTIEGSMDRNATRLQAVLRDRFGLVLRSEMREMPIYNLVQAKGGAKLTRHEASSAEPPSLASNGRQITGRNVPIGMLAQQLSLLLDRPVHNETHIDGQFDFELRREGEGQMSESLFTALTEQLGLKLESAKGPIQVYVIEKLEYPTEN
jgi:uncharacterized protein (TIGR03435 family)